MHFHEGIILYFEQNSTENCSQGPIDDNPALGHIMASRRAGDKPLSEPMLTQCTDAYMRH